MTNRRNFKGLDLSAAALALGLMAVACGSDDADPVNTTTPTHIEITGTWVNADFGQTDVIDDETWTSSFGPDSEFTSTITKFSNSENFAILEGADGTFNRNVWTDVDDDSFYTCTPDFGLESAEEAEASESPADDSDPESGGCGKSSFPWTKLTAAE